MDGRIKGKLEFRWGDTNLDTGEPINSASVDLILEKEDLEMDDKMLYDRVFSPVLSSVLNSVRDRVLGKNWFMRRLGRKLNIPSLSEAKD